MFYSRPRVLLNLFLLPVLILVSLGRAVAERAQALFSDLAEDLPYAFRYIVTGDDQEGAYGRAASNAANSIRTSYVSLKAAAYAYYDLYVANRLLAVVVLFFMPAFVMAVIVLDLLSGRKPDLEGMGDAALYIIKCIWTGKDPLDL